jgi:hypothetical protein
LKIALKILSQENTGVISRELDEKIRAKWPGMPAGDTVFPQEWQELLDSL